MTWGSTRATASAGALVTVGALSLTTRLGRARVDRGGGACCVGMCVGRLEGSRLLWSGAPVFLVGRTLTLWAAVGMVSAILGSLFGWSGRVTHRELGRMRGWSTTGEGAEACHWSLGEVFWVGVTAVTASLASYG